MPCNSVQLNRVDFSITDLDLLQKALDAKGMKAYRVGDTLKWVDSETHASVSLANGKLSFPNYLSEIELVNRTKRAYSEQVVKTITARMGWKTTVKGSHIIATRGY